MVTLSEMLIDSIKIYKMKKYHKPTLDLETRERILIEGYNLLFFARDKVSDARKI